MKKTIDLLNEVVEMGFDREYALKEIDAVLDVELDERCPLIDEEISESLYDDILYGFDCEKEF
nr:MAG TPA_asm: UBA-like domain protein [Caudoviricetes sp.]